VQWQPPASGRLGHDRQRSVANGAQLLPNARDPILIEDDQPRKSFLVRASIFGEGNRRDGDEDDGTRWIAPLARDVSLELLNFERLQRNEIRDDPLRAFGRSTPHGGAFGNGRMRENGRFESPKIG
jgi:hypothetical protein